MPAVAADHAPSIAANPEPGNAWDAPLNIVPDTSIPVETHIGWLKEIGVDHGWGPTSVMQWVLEHIQVYSGLPWAGSVIAMALLLRLVFFPMMLNSSDMSARIASMAPILKPIQERTARAREDRDQQAILQTWKEVKDIYRQAGIKHRVVFYPIIATTVFGYSSFILTRSMTRLPVPGLDSGSFLWLTDLTIPDPIFLLPAISAGLTYFVFRRGGEFGSVTKQQAEMMKSLKAIAPPLMFVFGAFQPGLVQVGWVAASFTAVLQSHALRSKYWRRFFKLQPLPENSARAISADASPYQGVLNKYQPSPASQAKAKTFFGDIKAKALKYMRKKEGKAPRLRKQDMSKAERYEQERRKEIEADLIDRQRRGRRR